LPHSPFSPRSLAPGTPAALLLDFLDRVKNLARKVGIEGLYYITHFGNVVSILQNGILSHDLVEKKEINFTPIYNREIVNLRSTKVVQGDKTLWNFANLYFQPRNPMLYSLKYLRNEIAILCIKRNILDRQDISIATGNAAHRNSKILPIEEGKQYLPMIRDEIDKEWWNAEDGSKRKIMAECLVPEFVPAKFIHSIYVAHDEARKNLEKVIIDSGISNSPELVVEPKKFFLDDWRASLTSNIDMIRGDMFFSDKQTMTISVNCVGAMGRGLASTAKYRFPDLYVKYQDACKHNDLQIGKPFLYKRESSIFNELADLDFCRVNQNYYHTWFLLFPTKRHWKNKADIHGIEKGLQWILDNYKNKGIESLALPALGCGLGQLEWQDVGRLMCKYITAMDIPVAIYLPGDRELSKDLLSPKFLL